MNRKFQENSDPIVSRLLMATPQNITLCAETLNQGQLVAFPTETVYGLGADATQDEAVAGIFAAKSRPQFNPLITHVSTASNAEELALFDSRARILADVFWPGPLTLVLPRKSECPLSLLVSAGMDTIGIRVPRHPVAQALLKAFGKPIAAPSANTSGEVSPTTPLHVMDSLKGRVPYILADGRCDVGLESTILDMCGSQPLLIRPGAVLQDQIESVIGPISVTAPINNISPSAPGQMSRHYAPSIPVRLNAPFAQEGEAFLGFGPTLKKGSQGAFLNLSETSDLTEAATHLFSMLRALDHPPHHGIAVAPIPETGLGIAINDRLRRAATPKR